MMGRGVIHVFLGLGSFEGELMGTIIWVFSWGELQQNIGFYDLISREEHCLPFACRITIFFSSKMS